MLFLLNDYCSWKGTTDFNLLFHFLPDSKHINKNFEKEIFGVKTKIQFVFGLLISWSYHIYDNIKSINSKSNNENGNNDGRL